MLQTEVAGLVSEASFTDKSSSKEVVTVAKQEASLALARVVAQVDAEAGRGRRVLAEAVAVNERERSAYTEAAQHQATVRSLRPSTCVPALHACAPRKRVLTLALPRAALPHRPGRRS